MSSAEPHVSRDDASPGPAPVWAVEPHVDAWVVAALVTPVAIPLLCWLGDDSTSLALRTSLLFGMAIALGAGFALLARSRAQSSTRKLTRWVLRIVLTLFLGTLALNLAFGPDVARNFVQSSNDDFCGPHHGPCERPVLTDHDLDLAMTSFFFATPLPSPRPGPDV